MLFDYNGNIVFFFMYGKILLLKFITLFYRPPTILFILILRMLIVYTVYQCTTFDFDFFITVTDILNKQYE